MKIIAQKEKEANSMENRVNQMTNIAFNNDELEQRISVFLLVHLSFFIYKFKLCKIYFF